MQGNTHRVGGMLCAVAGYTVLQSKGMLLEDINPILQLVVMYPFAIYGAVMPDLDQNWQSCPSKDFVSFGINRVLHLSTALRKKSGKKRILLGIFDAKHRSWQTHSDLFLIMIMVLAYFLLNTMPVGADSMVFKLIATGFILGLMSHLVLDALTPEGIWTIVPSVISGSKKTLRLVPKAKFFATGGPWERIIRVLMWLAFIFLVARIIYYAQPYRISFNL